MATDVYDEVPSNMHDFIREMPNSHPTTYIEGESEMWERFDKGLCMTCGGKLRGHTTLIVNGGGIAAAFCTGVCATDMANIGFLQEAHDDIVDRIKFRGGQGDGE